MPLVLCAPFLFLFFLMIRHQRRHDGRAEPPRLDGRVMNRIELKGKPRAGKIDKNTTTKRFSFLFE
jgi:hypothetical protein